MTREGWFVKYTIATQIDRELIANELEKTMRLAARLKLTEEATEIGFLVSKYRKPREEQPLADKPRPQG